MKLRTMSLAGLFCFVVTILIGCDKSSGGNGNVRGVNVKEDPRIQITGDSGGGGKKSAPQGADTEAQK